MQVILEKPSLSSASTISLDLEVEVAERVKTLIEKYTGSKRCYKKNCEKCSLSVEKLVELDGFGLSSERFVDVHERFLKQMMFFRMLTNSLKNGSGGQRCLPGGPPVSGFVGRDQVMNELISEFQPGGNECNVM